MTASHLIVLVEDNPDDQALTLRALKKMDGERDRVLRMV